MRYLKPISVCLLFVLVLAACQPAELTPLVPKDQEPLTARPESTPQSPEIQPTQPSNPLLTPEDTDMGSPTTPDAAAQKMVDLAKEHLAQRLGIAVEQITLLEVRPASWRDASLGCPKPGVDYIQVETPGFSIVLETGGKTYNLHTDRASRVVMCASLAKR